MKLSFIFKRVIVLKLILVFSVLMVACNIFGGEYCISGEDMYKVCFELQSDTVFRQNSFFIIEDKEDMKRAQAEYEQLYDLPYFKELLGTYPFEEYTLFIELIKSDHVASLDQKQIRIDRKSDTLYTDIDYENNDNEPEKYWALYWIIEKDKLSRFDFSKQKKEIYPLSNGTVDPDEISRIADEIKEGEFVIPDSATKYEFDVKNLLKYKSVIVDRNYIIYVFSKHSELVDVMQRYEGMKVWLEYYNNPLGYKFDAKWDFIEGRNDYFLIIYCNTALYDFDKGIGLSNIFKDDSVTFYSWSERESTIEVTISGIEYPHLCIYKHNDPSRYTQRYTEENTWSEIDSYEFINWDP